MKSLAVFLPIAFIMGCATTEPQQVPEPNFPEANRSPYQSSITTNCFVAENNTLHTKLDCKFDNGTYSTASLCVQISFIRTFGLEPVFTTNPVCSGMMAPLSKSVFSLELRSNQNRTVNFGCGRDLKTCHIRIDPVREESLAP